MPELRMRPLEDVLADVLDRRGVTPIKLGSDWMPHGHRVISAKHIKGGRVDLEAGEHRFVDSVTYRKWMRSRLEPGDVLLTSEAPLGATAYIGKALDWCLGQRLFALRPRPGVLDGRFLFYALAWKPVVEDLLSRATGTTAQGIRQTELRRVLVPCPALDEQGAIGSILGALDDKIELNDQMNGTLEELARTIFRSWFVDFDPVRANAEGRQPVGMDAETAKLFPSRFVESELGEIPEGWRIAPLPEWADALSGGTPAKSNASLWGGDLPWISPKVMTEIHADEADAFVTRPAVGNGTRLAPPGSTLVMVRGMGLHKEVRVSQARREVTFNQDVKALVPKGIEPTLLLLALLDAQSTLLGRVQSSGHGTGVLPSDILLAQRICLPPSGVQKMLVTPLDAMNDRIAAGRWESRTLAELRDLLLPRLISGKLRISDAEKLVEDVA